MSDLKGDFSSPKHFWWPFFSRAPEFFCPSLLQIQKYNFTPKFFYDLFSSFPRNFSLFHPCFSPAHLQSYK